MEYIASTYRSFVDSARQTGEALYDKYYNPPEEEQEELNQEEQVSGLISLYSRITRSAYNEIDKGLEETEKMINSKMTDWIVLLPFIILIMLVAYINYIYMIAGTVLTYKLVEVYTKNEFDLFFTSKFVTIGVATVILYLYIGVILQIAQIIYICTGSSFVYKLLLKDKDRSSYKKISDTFIGLLGISALIFNFLMLTRNKDIIGFLMTSALGELVAIPMYFLFLYTNIIIIQYMVSFIINKLRPTQEKNKTYKIIWKFPSNTILIMVVASIAMSVFINGALFGTLGSFIKGIFSFMYLAV